MKLSAVLARTGVVVVATAMFGGATGAAADEPAPRTIRVRGEHSVQAVPDRARISVSVVTRAAGAGEASADNARVSREVLQKLREAVEKPGEVRTGGYELSAEYDYRDRGGAGEGPRLVGYTATNRFAIVSADLEGLGGLIDASIAAGANRIDSISFFLDDDTSVRREALIAAGRAARDEAETVAEALGVDLGEVLDAATVAAPRPPVEYGRMAAMAEAAPRPPTEIIPGSLEISASVSVTFSIR